MNVAKDSDEYGDELRLGCTKHAAICTVKNATDFIYKTPHSKCTAICNEPLACGHRCADRCHSDHRHGKCTEKCLKTCPAGHQCQG